jgi:TonB-linked SusC/RagA family outer membrane protein
VKEQGAVGNEPAAQQARRTITGTVTDPKGEPIIGANIVEKGSGNGTISDLDGKFSLSVAGDAVLQVSYIGYLAQEIAVGNQTRLTVTLREDTQALEEVVVIGYGTQKKAHLIGSVTTLDADEIKSVSTGNLTNALAGRLTGVSIRQTSGGRPGNSSSMNIRAIGTWNSTSPLYVIDGVVRDSRAFDMLTSSEVETVTVLKDASAATVYGSRAANGVILVTTKKGKEGKVNVNYGGSVSFGSFTVAPERESLQTRIRIANEARREFYNPWEFDATGYKVPVNKTNYRNGVDASEGYISIDVFTDEAVAYYQTKGDGYDWLEDAYRTPITQTHSVDVSGGSDKITYFIGANYYDEGGMFKSLTYDKYSVRSNFEAKLGYNLTASLAMNINKSTDSRSANEDTRGSVLYNTLLNTSRLYPSMVDGKYIGRSTTGDGFQQRDSNPVAEANGEYGYTDNIYNNSEFTAGLRWDIPWVKGLNAKLNYNRYERSYLDKTVVTPYQTYKLVRDPSDVNGFIMGQEIDATQEPLTWGNKGSIAENRYNADSYQLNASINYSATFGKHEVGAMLNYEQYEYHYENMYGSKSEMQITTLPYFDFGVTDQLKWSLSGAGSEDARLSYLGRFNYAYNGRYLAEFSFRRDASVKFAPEHRWGFFPSGSLAWRVSEEEFWRNNVPFINNFKLRGSIGLTGNDAVGAFQWMERASIGGTYYVGGDAALPTANITTEANPLITWEKSRNYNYGVDLGFLNMFTLTFDGYFRHTYDILGSQTGNLPDVFGGALSDSNYGVVDSWGYEVELGFNKQVNRDISVWAKGNFGFADNKLVEWAEVGVPEHLSRIGKNWDRVAGFLSDGLITSVHQNADGTYDITTNTGSVYRGVLDDYDSGGWENRRLSDGNHNAYGPGVIFSKDLRGTDADGNFVDEPNGHLSSGDEDKTWIIERLIPPYTYGLLFGGSWKGLSLDVLLQGTGGNQNFLHSRNNLESGARGSSYAWYTANNYSYFDNPNGIYPRMNNGSSSSYKSDFWVRDASFLRLKNVTITYEIPKKALAKVGLTQANIYCSGNNLALLWNPMKYYDPETTGGDGDKNVISSGDSGSYQYVSGITTYPMVRTITFGVNINF